MDQNATHASPDSTWGLPPPPGVIPNPVYSPEKQGGLPVLAVFGLFLTTVCVWVRVWTKVRIIKEVEWEDYLSFAAWMGGMVYAGLGYLSSHVDDGAQLDVPLQDVSHLAQLANVEEILYCPLIFLTKLSILLQYLRIFVPNHAGKLYYTVLLIIWLNLLFYTATTLVEIFTCMPRKKIWEPSTPGRCVNTGFLVITTGAINVISDFSILMLPLSSIWGLQMPKKRKIALSAVFATGLFACITSIMRLVISVEILNTKGATYDPAPLDLWVTAELISGIVCGCLPILPRFFHHYISKITTKLSSNHQRKGHSHSTETPLRAGPLELPAYSGNSLELKERDGLERTQGYSFMVKGSRYQESQTFIDLEDGAPKHGISKDCAY